MTKIRANRLEEWLKKRGYSLKQFHNLLVEQGEKVDYTNLSAMKNHSRPIPKKYIEGLAKALDINVTEIYHNHQAGLTEDYSPWKAPDDHFLAGTKSQDTKFTAKMLKNILDEVEIYPGDILIFDLSKQAFRDLKNGDIVMAQLYDDNSPEKTKTVIRQYIEPNLLITNSAITQNSIIHVRQNGAQIKAVLSDIYRSKK